MLSNCTLNETTLATGASVPTTNAEPVALEAVEVSTTLLLQPARRAAAASKGKVKMRILKGLLIIEAILSRVSPRLLLNAH